MEHEDQSLRHNSPMTVEPLSRATAWTRYWQTGAAHSCAGSYSPAYEGAIADFWRAGFSSLPPGSRILDLGTGNGPLPKIMVAMASRSDLQCDAIDLAQVAPPWFAELSGADRARIRFHSGCSMEALPFEAATFDLVVSQWGLEYSNLEVSTPEVLRVLAPGGRIQLLLHHVDALPVTLAAHEVVHLQWLLNDSPYLESVEHMLEPMALATTAEGRSRLMQDAQANQAKEAFNAQQDTISSRIEQGACTDVLVDVRQFVGTLFGIAQNQGAVAAGAALQGLRLELQDSRLRLQELCDHAMDHATAEALAMRLAHCGSYQLEVMRDQQTIMGWALTVAPALP
jgi:SAM-dependent methyltransferase